MGLVWDRKMICWDSSQSVGIHPNFVPSQTPTIHPSRFVWHINCSVPKRKVFSTSRYTIDIELLNLIFWIFVRHLSWNSESFDKWKWKCVNWLWNNILSFSCQPLLKPPSVIYFPSRAILLAFLVGGKEKKN